MIDRKFIVTRLFACDECRLAFRHPRDAALSAATFYEDDYMEGDGITTTLPSETELEEMRQSDFKSFPQRSVRRLSAIFAACGAAPGATVVDYGASWGYTIYQMQTMGLNVEGFEISKRRARYGTDHLGVAIHTSLSSVRRNNDIFYCSHVIEHVANPADLIVAARDLLSADGFAVFICPNGSPEFRIRNPRLVHLWWGKVHPNLMTASFFRQAFGECPYFLATNETALELSATWNGHDQIVADDLTGGEIFLIARPNQKKG
jgi:hypothetical protein